MRFEVDAFVPDVPAGTSSGNGEPVTSPEPESPVSAKQPTTQDVGQTKSDEVSNWDAGAGESASWGYTAPTANGASDWGADEISKSAERANRSEADLWGPGLAAGVDDWGSSAPPNASSSQRLSKQTSTTTAQVVSWSRAVDDPGAWDSAAPQDDGSARQQDSGASKATWGAGGGLPEPVSTPEFIQTSSFVPIADFKVLRAGTLLPQESILELATRSSNYLDRTSSEDTFLQMFLTQTPTHLVAVHQRGTFDRVIRQELHSPEFVDIAEREDIQRSLVRFVALLREIQRLVREHARVGRVSLVCERGKLELFGRVGEEGLVRPGELLRFNIEAKH